MIRYITTIFTLILIILSEIGYGQQYLFKSLNVKDGLSQSNVEAIAQDKYGYIWIATQHGLNRYDGYSFQKFVHNPEDSTSFKFPFVRTMYFHSDGDLVVSIDNELALFDYKKEQFQYFKNPFVELASISFELDAERIMEDKQGNIWAGVSNTPFWWFNKKEKKFMNSGIENVEGFEIVPTPITLIDENNCIWTLAYKQDTIYAVKLDIDAIYKTGKPAYTFYKIRYWKRPRDKTSYGAYFSVDNKIILHVFDYLTYAFDKEKNQFIIQNEETWRKVQKIEDIVSDGKNIYVASEQNGLFVFDRELNLKSNIRKADHSKSLKSDQVEDLFICNTGVLWIATSFGMSYIDLNKKPFNEISQATGFLPENVISTLALDQEENIWISTKSGLNIISQNLKENKFYKYSDDLNQIFVAGANKFFPYKQNTMLIGNIGIGKLNYDEQIYQYSNPLQGEGSYKSWVTWDIERGKATGRIWFGGHDGLSYMVPDDYPEGDKGKQAIMPEKFVFIPQKENGIRRYGLKNIWTIYETYDSLLWIGTNEGLTRHDIKTGEFKILGEEPGEENLHLIAVKDVHEDKKNRLWVATEGSGLIHLDHDGSYLEGYNVNNGLPSDLVWNIEEDKSGNLWLATSNGLSRFDPDSVVFINYFHSHGLPSSDFIRGANAQAKDGTLFFGTQEGVVYFNPQDIKINSIPPKVLISNIYLFNKPVQIGEKINGEEILNNCILETDEIEFSYKNNIISIEFTGIHFPSPEHISYQYMLKGFDKEWVKASSNERRAYYTNLPAGKYEFKVKAANYDGVYSENEARMILVTIKPPFWKTWGFRISVSLIIILLAWLTYKRRVRNLQMRQIILARQVKERTQEIREKNEELLIQSENLIEVNSLLKESKEELESQADKLILLNATKDKFFGIIAHDLKNPFHAITGLASLLKKNYGDLEELKRMEFISMIEQSSKSASSLLENLLTWSRTQTGRMKFEPKHTKLKEIIDETINLLRVNAERKRIELYSTIDENTSAFCDANMVTTIIRNLLNNAIKFTDEKGSVAITSKPEEEFLHVEIKDNGVGMTKEEQEALFKIDQQHSSTGTAGESGTGLGLIVCKEFVEKNGGQIWVNSKKGMGSTFIFTLPLNKR